MGSALSVSAASGREMPAGISASSVSIQKSFHCLSHGSVRYRHRNRERACVYSAGISRGRQPVPAGVTVEKSRKPFVFLLFQDSGTRTSLKGDPGMTDGHRSVRYEIFHAENLGIPAFRNRNACGCQNHFCGHSAYQSEFKRKD